MTNVFLAVVLFACGGDQRSGAAPADTVQVSGDTAATVGIDTASRDTTPAQAAADTAVTRRDTTPKVAAKPVPRRTRKPSATATPQPRADTAATPDTSQPSATAPAQPDTAAAQPSETTAAAPAPTTQASAPLHDPYHRPPLDTVPQQVYDGWKQYNLNCARCHGEDVMGTTIAPHLLVSVKPDGPISTKELFVQTVCAGRPVKGMPAWCPLGMEMPTIEAIYAYVKGRADAKLRPGRPALKAGG
jgi:hypothetical protein